MELTELINFCKENYPEKMIEICEIIDLLIDTLNGLKSEIGKAVPALNEDNSFESIRNYMNHSEKIADLIQSLNNISNDITIDEIEETEQDETQTQDINYSNKSFDVDAKVPHTLYEDFTYTKPAGIKIENTYIEANEWRDIFNKSCQYLFQKNNKLFISFLDDSTMRGRSRKYFSYNPSDLREANLIKGSDIYLECNVSAIFVRNIIIKMLEKYEIPKRQCNLFIRRDLASLHNDSTKRNIYEAAKNIEESSDEIGIGRYAKEYFSNYFQNNMPKEEIDQFTNKEWCHNTFGICYPILKQVNSKIPIGEQLNYNNQYRRYYKNPVLKINGNEYIICSQWFSNFKPKLISWINKSSNNSSSNLNDDIKLGKKYCSISLPKSLFIYILKTIELYNGNQFETGNLSANLSDLISLQTNYEKPQHVINNIRKFLEDEGILSLDDNCKKGKYKIIDMVKLQNLIKENSNK